MSGRRQPATTGGGPSRDRYEVPEFLPRPANIASTAPTAAATASAPDAWRLFAALMVDAFRARPETPLPPAPPEQLRRSIALLTEGR